ncbi:hypothetical protein JYK21_06925 [Ralstonia pickettii]|nr:hypothetical protein [Ralstonia pickettii]
MGISKWDLFKQIEELPNEKYPEIKSYLDKMIKLNQEVTLDEQSKQKMEKSLYEYEKGEYLEFDQVFEKGDK